MTKHTAEDFAAAEFARRKDGRIAARTDPHDRGPWEDRERGYTDAEMAAASGWRIVRDAESLTAREHLGAAWEKAHEVDVIPAGAGYVTKWDDGVFAASLEGEQTKMRSRGPGFEYRLLDPPAPPRPEGAEEIERLLTEGLGDFSPPATPEAIADLLAVRGVRVVTEDPSGPLRPLTTDERSYRYAQDLGYELPEDPR
ncbi:hypothetical protein M3F63_07135 [Brachybacterium muris]|uniref:hypothetical protein n=1 Tax=Brachybacterium muris TaxID=219301 RepID=UPI00223AAF21|nr:hypothetical protein [Brachybacterium muris]MCT2177442.1 hypothetical protein [Brachybacterium muris]